MTAPEEKTNPFIWSQQDLKWSQQDLKRKRGSKDEDDDKVSGKEDHLLLLLGSLTTTIGITCYELIRNLQDYKSKNLFNLKTNQAELDANLTLDTRQLNLPLSVLDSLLSLLPGLTKITTFNSILKSAKNVPEFFQQLIY